MAKKMRWSLVIALSVLSGLFLGTRGVIAQKETTAEAELPLDQLRAFADVYGHIKENYVDNIDDEQLLQSAIRGMLAGLDPHSAYLDSDEYDDLKIGTSGEFGGLGIEVSMENGFVKVIAPMDDTPAKRAGIQSGDLIVRLDDTPVKGMSLNDAIKYMRGKPGTDVLLTIVREGTDGPLKIAVTRDIIQVKSVKSRLLDDTYAYVRITHFQTHTAQDMLQALDRLRAQKDRMISGMILDLRDNPGGLLDAAIGVADAFIERGLLVYHEGRVPGATRKYNATPGDTLNGAPIVVLINEGSASASEIVAGALQDHVRAILVGTQSFGKGSVQTVQELKDGSAIKLTTSRYYTPKGRSIQAAGIQPDIVIDPLKLRNPVNERDLDPVKEANLNRHLSNPTDKENDTSTHNGSTESRHLAESDYQLFEALNLLKALRILNVSSSSQP